ncbi:hypothetical protein [Kribbella karoonensis]|uniref:Glycoside hydrolase family 42 N-terminal domain-containing protein n=1 Tax=Kribbella karoonensis TaxID=324851 RepID=A0ABN2DY10_9ACTN
MKRWIAALAAVALVAFGQHATAKEQQQAQQAFPDVKTRTKGIIPPGGMLSSKTGGNTIDAELREETPRADGRHHYDSRKLVERLKAMHVNTYLFGIWESPTDWDDLRSEFAPLARAAGIDIWVDLVPPSECQTDRPEGAYLEGYCSRPFKLDFIAWARNIATLSLQYPNIKAWQVDDFLVAENAKLFTPDYLGKVKATQDAINPNLGLLTTMYRWDYSDANLDRLAPYIDGAIFPYLGGSQSASDPRYVAAQLDELRAKLNPRHLDLILLLYTDRFLDAALPPTPEAVNQELKQAMPYAADGRIGGIIAYGAPVNYDRRPTIASNNLAQTGDGRLSFAQGNYTTAAAGGYAEASQQVTVDPNAGSWKLDFATYDQVSRTPSKSGKLFKQVLVDDKVVWQSDVADEFGFTWAPASVDLTAALKGRTTAKLSLRLYTQAAANFPIDVGFDSLVPTGFTVQNFGFEDVNPATRAWQLNQQSASIVGSFEKVTPHQAKDVYDVISAAFAGADAPAVPTTPSDPIPGNLPRTGAPYQPGGANTIHNSAMYGKGRLSLFVPEKTATGTSTCIWAEQRMAVDPNAPRYEISWWDYDEYAADLFGYHLKQVLIVTSKGKKLLSNVDAASAPKLWMNGQGGWGPIDVTEFARGESSVVLQFALCEQQGVGDYMIDVGYDDITAVGLTVTNGDFEQGTTGWTIVSPHPGMQAKVVTAP